MGKVVWTLQTLIFKPKAPVIQLGYMLVLMAGSRSYLLAFTYTILNLYIAMLLSYAFYYYNY